VSRCYETGLLLEQVQGHGGHGGDAGFDGGHKDGRSGIGWGLGRETTDDCGECGERENTMVHEVEAPDRRLAALLWQG